jgi:CRISPR-associated exonuclease Cas4
MSDMLWLPFTIIALLLLVGAWLLSQAQRINRATGLPPGKITYEDVSNLAQVALMSAKHGVRGKPDYLLQDEANQMIPVEVKSRQAPPSNKPYDGHVLQLAAYFLLVEEALNGRVPYGLLRYRNRTLRVRNTPQLRGLLLSTINKMRAQLAADNAYRNHANPAKCARCSFAHACDEKLER